MMNPWKAAAKHIMQYLELLSTMNITVMSIHTGIMITMGTGITDTITIIKAVLPEYFSLHSIIPSRSSFSFSSSHLLSHFLWRE